MAGGVIHAESAVGDAFFYSSSGKEILEPSKGVRVKLDENFGGSALEDAIHEARKHAVGAIKNKVEQKTRGSLCNVVVKNVEVKYKVKYGFSG